MATTHSFTPAQLRELRTQMEEDLARVLRSTAKDHEATGTTWTGGSWNADGQSTAVQLEAVLQGSAQDRLESIKAALHRLDVGAYGDCTRCGNRISFGRLSVMPEATLCVACGAI